MSLFSNAEKVMTTRMEFVEYQTGRMRPRHMRFHLRSEKLTKQLGLDYNLVNHTIPQRIKTKFATHIKGVRGLNINGVNRVTLIHQALNFGSTPYIAEFDVPLALHGYDVKKHQSAFKKAKEIMERPNLKAILTFSNWASRSFGMHFGEEVESKCRTLYPLAFEGSYCGSFERREFDFCFISTQFRIKSGPEVVKAFNQITTEYPDAMLCMVTDLSQARKYLGSLEKYKNITWQEANLSSQQVADLLAQSRCLLHPTLSDSFGVVVLEALAAGCAIISSQIASFPELVGPDNGDLLSVPTSSVVGDGFITEFGNVTYHEAYLATLSLHHFTDLLINSMDQFLSDPVMASKKMKASYEKYLTTFSPDVWDSRMQSILISSFPDIGLQD